MPLTKSLVMGRSKMLFQKFLKNLSVYLNETPPGFVFLSVR